MDTIQKAVLIAHTLIALLIIVLVLLQRGKGADAGAAFGAGASGTVFGARGSSSFFSRATAVCATVFFVSSLTLAYLSSQALGADEPPGRRAGRRGTEAEASLSSTRKCRYPICLSWNQRGSESTCRSWKRNRRRSGVN